MWIILVIFYGILKGIRDVIKKKSLQKNTVIEVLFAYTFIAFLFVTPEAPAAINLELKYILLICLKSALVFTAWICSFKAIKKLPISFFGVMDLSGVLFSTAMGVLFLNEVLTMHQTTGLIIVMAGLFMVNIKTIDGNTSISIKYVVLALLSCILNAGSGVMDKMLMQTNAVTSGQLQFWFMFIMVLFYIVYIVVKRTKLDIKSILTNYWIFIMSIMFVVGDRALFYANSLHGYTVSAATLIKQSACFVSIIGGKLFFKEKNIAYRLCCAAVILAGICIAVI